MLIFPECDRASDAEHYRPYPPQETGFLGHICCLSDICGKNPISDFGAIFG
ncbi:hypothetical protein PJF56_04460 [Roseofilum sp. BLCC_M91]|uniref:Uncharacterized protein n=1 Tax=Roseofilum halophilum BLCC-M91 TaxID=3022259 RepID=A0ABT7BG07_9CYAN|nr:hypothetical protein [Roseofilum halophilum]MDJ1178111.1 hypothetical protein [Roseofilum halophilum BLCC-M91]